MWPAVWRSAPGAKTSRSTRGRTSCRRRPSPSATRSSSTTSCSWWGDVETRIGSFVHLASFSSYLGRGRLVIDDFVSVSSGARLYTGIDDFSGGCLVGPGVPEPYRQPTRTFVNMGKYALVGANAVVFPGVTLGEGCAIGALSLVNRDCEPWTIYGGVPARPIKQRGADRIHELEAKLRSDLYDGDGQVRAARARDGRRRDAAGLPPLAPAARRLRRAAGGHLVEPDAFELRQVRAPVRGEGAGVLSRIPGHGPSSTAISASSSRSPRLRCPRAVSAWCSRSRSTRPSTRSSGTA